MTNNIFIINRDANMRMHANDANKIHSYLTCLFLVFIIIRVSLFDLWQSTHIALFGVSLNPSAMAGIVLAIIGLITFCFGEANKKRLCIAEKQHQNPFQDQLLIILLLFLVVNALLTFQSTDYKTSLEEVIRVFNYLILYWLGYTVLSNKKSVQSIFGACVIVGIIISAISISQYVQLGGNFETIDFPNRIQGPFPHPNVLGFTAAFLLIISIGVFLHLKESNKRAKNLSPLRRGRLRGGIIACSITLLLLAPTLLFTYTRGAWLAFLIGIIVLLVLLVRKKFLKVVFITLLALIAVHSFSYIIFEHSPFDRFITFTPIQRIIQTPKDPDNTLSGRIDLWRYGWEIFKQDPITGWGLGNYHRAVAFYLRIPPDEGLNPHNDFVRFLVESGIVGFGLFIALVITWFYKAITAYQRLKLDPQFKIVSATILCAGITFFLGTLTDNVFRFTGLLWLFWLMSGAYFGWIRKNYTL